MANDFQVLANLQQAVDDAAALLHGEMIAMGLVNRRIEQDFVPKGGGLVTVWVRPTLTATLDDVSGGVLTLPVTDNQQTAVNVEATNYAFIRQDVTTKQLSFDIDDFVFEVVQPGVQAIAEQIDIFTIRRMAGGFAANVTGTAGASPSTVPHILAARKKYQDNKGPMRNLASLIGTTPEESFLQLDNFANADFGDDGPTALREARLARRYGIDFFVSVNAGGIFEEGDEAGTVVANGAGVAGASAASFDAFTAATGKIREGTRITVSGDTQEYAVTADTAIVGNAVSGMPISPVIGTGWIDAAAVTFLTPFTQDLLFNTNSVAGAVISPAPLANNSVVGRFGNISVRMTMETTTTTSSGATDILLLDTFIAAKVLRPELGIIMQG